MTPRILVLLAAVLLFCSLHARDVAGQEKKGSSYTKIPTVKGIEILKAGTRAPDFSVRDIAGKEFHIREAASRDAVVLFFWSYFCGPCREEFPVLNSIAREFDGKGLQVIGVNLDGSEMKRVIDKMAATEKISFRIVFDELDGDDFRVADPYGVAGTPALFVIDRNGVITFSAVGIVAADALRREISKVAR